VSADDGLWDEWLWTPRYREIVAQLKSLGVTVTKYGCRDTYQGPHVSELIECLLSESEDIKQKHLLAIHASNELQHLLAQGGRVQ
jgi:hypothetical protein